jgi:hypothetical protein
MQLRGSFNPAMGKRIRFNACKLEILSLQNTKLSKRNASLYRSIKTEIRKSDTEGRG